MIKTKNLAVFLLNLIMLLHVGLLRAQDPVNIVPFEEACSAPGKWLNPPRIKFWYCLDENGEAGFETAEISEGLSLLNSLFAQVGITFNNMGNFPMANYQFNELESKVEESQMTTMYYQLGAINVYLVSDIYSFIGSDPEGYSFLPPNTRDCIILKKEDIGEDSKKLAHLMGHFFGLHNTSESDLFGSSSADNSDCETTGDLICDTYADPTGTADPGNNCNYSGPNFVDINGTFYYPPVDNIMSDYPDACRCRFTVEQFDVMNSFRNSVRVNLW